jgi:lipopolysaccharide biosynthesis glycosyltransferase
MYIKNNIDELFEKETFSCVIAGKSYPCAVRLSGLNSGLMVIEPREEVFDELVRCIPIVDKMKSGSPIGDQDVFQYYLKDWKNNKQLELDEKYNAFSYSVDYYVDNGILSYADISVIHYAGKNKPWKMTGMLRIKVRLKLLLEKSYRNKLHKDYLRVLRFVRRNYR